MKLSPPQQAALAQALHALEGSKERWADAMCIDDAELSERIAFVFGIAGGYRGSDFGYDYHGGSNPRLTIFVPGEEPLFLAGRDLLAATRDLFGISRPGELF